MPSHGFFLDELVESVENGLGLLVKKGFCSAGFQPAVGFMKQLQT